MEIPKPEDETGFFIPTLNKTGYAVAKLDFFSKAFIEYASEKKGKVLEIGAAYGFVTLAALMKGAEVYCNDIEPRHLEIIEQKTPSNRRQFLNIVPGSFPEEVCFDANFFDAIFMSRVIHLFNVPQVEESILKIYRWLKPGGKLFIVADTPYLKNFKKFIPEYDKRVKSGEEWPGLINDTARYLEQPINHIPSLVHFMDDKIMMRLLLKVGFEIEKLYLMNRTDYPEDRRYDGRESVGAIAKKV